MNLSGEMSKKQEIGLEFSGNAGRFSVNIRLLHAFHPPIFPSTFNWNAIRERSRYQEMSLLIYYHYLLEKSRLQLHVEH